MVSLAPRLDSLQGSQNIIINGNLDFWQRGTSFTSVASSAYTADRFQYLKVGTMVQNITRSTDVPTFAQSNWQSVYSLLKTVTTAQAVLGVSDFSAMNYIVEGYDYESIHNKPFRLQFWVKSSIAGVYSVGLRNSSQTVLYSAPYTIAVANTWQLVSIDVPATSLGTWLFTNGVGMIIYFNQATGTARQTSTLNAWHAAAAGIIASNTQVNGVATIGATLQIAQVSLNSFDSSVSPQAIIPFSRAGKTFRDELAMAQRYYEKTYDIEVAPGTNNIAGGERGVGSASNSTVDRIITQFKVTKRAAPTFAFWRTTGASNVWDANDQTTGVTGTPSAAGINTQSASIGTTAVGLVVGRAGIVSGHYSADAEL